MLRLCVNCKSGTNYSIHEYSFYTRDRRQYLFAVHLVVFCNVTVINLLLNRCYNHLYPINGFGFTERQPQSM